LPAGSTPSAEICRSISEREPHRKGVEFIPPGWPLVSDSRRPPATGEMVVRDFYENSALAVESRPARSTTGRAHGGREGQASPEGSLQRKRRMRYVCLGYIDENKFGAIPQAEQQRMMEECFAYDDELRRGGHFLGGEALDSARNAVTLRTKDGNVEITDGPFAETKETLGGILLLEARDLNHAIALMSKHPGVRMGPFEIRPANEAINRLISARNAAVAKNSGVGSG
jgi:hypothetical protein